MGRLRKEVDISGLSLLSTVGFWRSPELAVDTFVICLQKRNVDYGNFVSGGGDPECSPRVFSGLAEMQKGRFQAGEAALFYVTLQGSPGGRGVRKAVSFCARPCFSPLSK